MIKLSAREKQILRLSAQGKSAKVVADELELSAFTIMRHLRNIREKWGIHTTIEAVVIAMKLGWLEEK